MTTQTITNSFVVTLEAQNVIAFLRKRHYYPRIITDFCGPIAGPIFSAKGDMIYQVFREEDRAIIPNAAFRLHDEVRRAGYRDLQVIIGHEILVASEEPAVPAKPKREIDWGNVANVAAKGFLIAALGVVMVPFYALAGAVTLIDPSYCIVLDDGVGSVIELMNWNSEE